MVWGRAARKSSDGDAVVGLDLNAGRARAVSGSPPLPPRSARLDAQHDELALSLALDQKSPRVGAAGHIHRRSAPHLLCERYLPLLGEPRSWAHGRLWIDPAGALTIAAASLRDHIPDAKTVYLTLPAYLSTAQAKLARGALEGAKLPVAGSCPLALALAVASVKRPGTVIVLDADDHATSWTLIGVDAKQVRQLGHAGLANHGVRAWVDRLMDVAADRCIQSCRRDPRDSAAAEQSMDEQITEFLAGPRNLQPLQLTVRTEHWYQTLSIAEDEIARAASPHLREIVEALRALLVAAPSPPDRLLVTDSAVRLPGLISAVGVRLPDRTGVEELSPLAPAEAAYALALRRYRGEIPASHLDLAVPRVEEAADRVPV